MTRIVRDYYELLGVTRDASAEEIHRAFRASARRWHPDVSAHPEAGERFHELSTAYEILHDPRERARYDRAIAFAERSRSLRRGERPTFTAHPPASVPRFHDETEAFALGPMVIRLSAAVRWLS